MNAFPSAAYDRWKTTQPEGPPECAVCPQPLVLDDPEDRPLRVPGTDDYVCSALCHARYDAETADTVAAAFKAVAEMMQLDDEGPTVNARLDGGGRTVSGVVVDWKVDGTELTVCHQGRDRRLTLENCRDLEVLPR